MLAAIHTVHVVVMSVMTHIQDSTLAVCIYQQSATPQDSSQSVLFSFLEFHCNSSTIDFNGVLFATAPGPRLHPLSSVCTAQSAAVPSRPVHSLRPLVLLPHLLPKFSL